SRRRAASWALQLLDVASLGKACFAPSFFQAVEYLHWRLSPAVIHRDIKPENILVQHHHHHHHHHHHSSAEVIKLVDFGLAVELSPDGYAKPKPQFRGGTVRYMAPENHDLDGKLSRACDVWSCALVLNELFGGSRPYRMCSTSQQIAARIGVFREVPRIDCDRTHWPVGLLQECASLRPENRPTVKTLRSELNRLNNASRAVPFRRKRKACQLVSTSDHSEASRAAR
ncbi:hypothetical protein FOZ62_002888, partial [Perkinsus olseni]